jgi:hypothetical protein
VTRPSSPAIPGELERILRRMRLPYAQRERCALLQRADRRFLLTPQPSADLSAQCWSSVAEVAWRSRQLAC